MTAYESWKTYRPKSNGLGARTKPARQMVPKRPHSLRAARSYRAMRYAALGAALPAASSAGFAGRLAVDARLYATANSHTIATPLHAHAPFWSTRLSVSGEYLCINPAAPAPVMSTPSVAAHNARDARGSSRPKTNPAAAVIPAIPTKLGVKFGTLLARYDQRFASSVAADVLCVTLPAG